MSIRERSLHRLFDVGVILKGIDGAIETVGGLVLLSLNPARLAALVHFFTAQELVEDPHDAIANFLNHSFAHLAALPGAKFWGALYLLVHGIVKLILVAGLLRARLWAYPAAIAVFGAFALYQLIYLFIQYSPWLLALTVLDAAVIALTVHEYRFMKQRVRQDPKPLA